MTDRHADDGRTDEQHMADVASHTLERLARLDDEISSLARQLEMLADWDRQRSHLAADEFLDDVAQTVRQLACCVPEAVRDIAATLPIRGLDYGDGGAR